MSRSIARPSLETIYEQEHFVEFYHTEDQFLRNLKSFAGAALKAGAPCIIIATPDHRQKLDGLLMAEGFDLDTECYVSLDASAVLETFMRNGLPDKSLFVAQIGEVLAAACQNGKPVRAFGEMVALLWERGDETAAVLLEQLWNDIARSYEFTLFCAYPAHYFSEKAHSEACQNIGLMHTSIIARDMNAFA